MKRKGFHIYLTPKQANALARVCGAVGGSPKGPRGCITDIEKKLRIRGYAWESGSLHTTGGVYFE